MGRTRKDNTTAEKVKAPRKTKQVQKGSKLQTCIQNKISIKKISNQKQIVAQFSIHTFQNGDRTLSIPVFRKDGLDYTPGFCLPEQLTQTFRIQQQTLQQYRICSQCTEIDVENIKQPKPSSRNSYCTICKVRFQDYKQHIQQSSHLSKMRASPYNKFIEEFCTNKRFQRFLNISQPKPQAQTDMIQEKTAMLLLQEQFPKIDRIPTDTDRSKQALYNKLKEQIIKKKLLTQNQCTIFNVLN